ncbi:MAG: hypothetical protein Q9227_008371 [Pyrenula ochraceoflavens]
MAQPSMIPSSITASLEHLAARPGVLATLILSRKDGSIIRSTGTFSSSVAETSVTKETAEATDTTNGAQAAENSTLDGNASTETKPVRKTPSPAELLASSVTQFVSAATQLRLHINPTASESEARSLFLTNPAKETLPSGNGRPNKPAESEMEDAIDDDVQLLRMRTKNHEVIIFPNTKFLCCVVQDHSKGAQSQINSAGR